VGFYERDDLVYVARVRNGFTPSLRDAVFKKFRRLEIPNCPFVNLPQRDKGRWGEGLTAEKMVECRWLKPRLVAEIEYAEWTDGNRLRHSKFVAVHDDKDAKDEHPSPLLGACQTTQREMSNALERLCVCTSLRGHFHAGQRCP
jgi:ATP-dependent DNA ligase